MSLPPPPPILIGKYRLIRPIGRGGMAEIHLAVAHGPGGFAKLAVLKRIWPELASDPELVQMFLDEARLSARLLHPNIVQTFEAGHDGERYFIAMEYLDGQPLSHVLNRLRGERALPFGLRLQVLAQVLAGLHYAHELRDYDGRALGVVHRDISPHNVFVTYAGTVKLVDFGIAKTLAASHQTRPGVLKGRLAYMAPEALRVGTVDRRADIFSVGVMLWEAIAGRRLWKDMTEIAIARALMGGEPIAPPPRTAEIPDEAYRVCARALAVKPEERYQTAAELQADLERLASQSVESNVRELGRVVAHEFQPERERLDSLVDKVLRAPVPEGGFEDAWTSSSRTSFGARSTGSYSVSRQVPAVLPHPLGSRALVKPPADAAPPTAEPLPAPVSPPPRPPLAKHGIAALAVATVVVALIVVATGNPTPKDEPSTTASRTPIPAIPMIEPVPTAVPPPQPAEAPRTAFAATESVDADPARPPRQARAGKKYHGTRPTPEAGAPTEIILPRVRPRSGRPIDMDDPYAGGAP